MVHHYATWLSKCSSGMPRATEYFRAVANLNFSPFRWR